MSTVETVVTSDLEFARVGDVSLELDLYKPADASGPLPALVWVHGGGWQVGDKAEYRERCDGIARAGFVVATVNYRFVPDAPWPAQLHDVKAAVRWLRANAAEHGVDGDRIAVGGASAGGHLASMAGLTAGDPDLDGDVGAHTGVSAAVGAVVTMFPVADLIALRAPSDLERAITPTSPGAALLGVEHLEDKDLAAARAASPRHRAHAAAPPHLILHGDHDAVMHAEQSRLLHEALSGAGAKSVLVVVSGVGHEDVAFERPTVLGAITGFLTEHLG